jgi:hypothetical protein
MHNMLTFLMSSYFDLRGRFPYPPGVLKLHVLRPLKTAMVLRFDVEFQFYELQNVERRIVE